MEKYKSLSKTGYIILLMLFFSSCGLSSQNSNKSFPRNLKTGKFVYKGMNKEFIVKRTQNTQTEYNDSIGYKIDFRIIWKSETEYDMIFVSGTKGCLNKGDVINVKIISWTKNSYKYEAFNKRCGGKKRGELIKIE